jgi:hypothetical protein
MNVAEAERALGEAKKAFATGNIPKGLKFLTISHRLSPSHETRTLLEQYSPSSPTSSASIPTSSQSAGNRVESTSQLIQDLTQSLHGFWKSISEIFFQFETKYIAPSMRQNIRFLFIMILVLVVIKYVFKQKIRFGALPGDLSYSSSNMSISAPVVTSFLVSFLLTGLLRAFQA